MFEGIKKGKARRGSCLSFLLRVAAGLVCGSLSGFIVAFGGLYNQAHAQGAGRDADAADFSVDDRTDFLDVGFEFSFGDAGGFLPDAAQILGLTAGGVASSCRGLLA